MKRRPTDFTPHLERYVFACHYVAQKQVVDLGSKSGYGSQILAWFARTITMIDNVPEVIKRAKQQTYNCDVDFIEMDLNEGYPDRTWEVAVAFEIIEHVKDPDKFVKNIYDHLEVGGRLVFSVPHMKEHIDHLTLFDKEKITSLIGKYFKLEALFWQESYGISSMPFNRYPKTYVGVGVKL